MALGEKSYFWDKPEGTLTPEELSYYQYSGQDLASVYESMYTTGICPSFAVSAPEDNPEQYIGSSLAVSAGEGLQVIVSPGVAMIKGRPYLASLTIPVIVEAGAITDILLRMDLQGQKPFIAVAAKRRPLNGTLVQNLTHDSLVYEIALATVNVPAASVQTNALMISDQRLNMTLHPTDQKPIAGLMKSIPHVDTLGLWEDWQALEAYCRSTWMAFISSATDEWAAFLAASSTAWQNYLAQCGGDWTTYKAGVNTEWGTLKGNISTEFAGLTGQYQTQIGQNQADFNLWFATIQGTLSGDVAADLAGKVAKLQLEKADKTHVHDDRYYTQGAIDQKVVTITADRPLIKIIPQGEDVPIPERTPNTFYLKITDTQSGGVPESIRVSPNMGIKVEPGKSKSGINFN